MNAVELLLNRVEQSFLDILGIVSRQKHTGSGMNREHVRTDEGFANDQQMLIDAAIGRERLAELIGKALKEAARNEVGREFQTDIDGFDRAYEMLWQRASVMDPMHGDWVKSRCEVHAYLEKLRKYKYVISNAPINLKSELLSVETEILRTRDDMERSLEIVSQHPEKDPEAYNLALGKSYKRNIPTRLVRLIAIADQKQFSRLADQLESLHKAYNAIMEEVASRVGSDETSLFGNEIVQELNQLVSKIQEFAATLPDMKDSNSESVLGYLDKTSIEKQSTADPHTLTANKPGKAFLDFSAFEETEEDERRIQEFKKAMSQVPSLTPLLNPLEILAKRNPFVPPNFDSDDSTIEETRTKEKKSTSKGEAETKLIAALNHWHQYDQNGSCLKSESIKNNELARRANVSGGSASAFFKKHFNGYAQYRTACLKPQTLSVAMRALNNEIQPRHLLGDHAELIPDDKTDTNHE